MKTNLFNNYSAPEMKVIEVELEGMLCESTGQQYGETQKLSNENWG